MAKFVRTELTSDMKSFVNHVAQSLADQHASGQDFKEAAREVSKRFLTTNSSQSAFQKLERSILDYMIEQGYVTTAVLNAGFIDENGIEISNPDEKLPKELSSRPYGCRIDFKDSENNDEVLELLYDQDFINVSAYKLRSHGVLYPTKSIFFAHPSIDCSDWAKDIVASYPGYSVSKTFYVVWSQYYDIEIETESSNKLIKYNKLK